MAKIANPFVAEARARIQLDGFLKAHGIYQEYTLADFEEERQALKDLGF